MPADLHARIERARHEVEQAARLAVGRSGPLVGGWTAAQIVGHLADWWALMPPRLPDIAAGRPTLPPLRNFLRWNDERAAEWAERTLDEALVAYRRITEEVTTLLDGLPAEALEQVGAMPWGAHDPLRVGIDELARHDEEHAGELRAACRRQPPLSPS